MKRFISVFAVVMALVATAASFSSCSKDDESKKSSLAGTTWVYSVAEGTEGIASIKVSFSDDTNFKMIMSLFGADAQTITGNYVYEGSTVTLAAPSLGDGTITGTISGDKMTMAINGVNYVFTKQ